VHRWCVLAGQQHARRSWRQKGMCRVNRLLGCQQLGQEPGQRHVPDALIVCCADMPSMCCRCCCRFSVVFDGEISLEQGKKYVIPGESCCCCWCLAGAGAAVTWSRSEPWHSLESASKARRVMQNRTSCCTCPCGNPMVVSVAAEGACRHGRAPVLNTDVSGPR
jgi:hypothetical protein